MKNFIIFIIFSFSLSLYSGDDLFPFGINHTVYAEFSTDTTGYCERYKRTLDSAATLGVKWWRAMRKFTWRSVEESQGEYDWRNEDSLVKWTGERDINIIPVIGEFYPGWAVSGVPDEYKDRYPFDANNWDKYMKFTQAMVERYDGDGIYITYSGDTVEEPEWLKKPVKYWECINEPYCTKQFLGDTGQYIDIFDSTRVALKKADPEAKLGGPCLNTKDTMWYYYDTEQDMLKYITYNYRDMLYYILERIDNIDFITHHIYHYSPDGPELTMQDIRCIRDTIIKNIEKINDNIPIWITECGYQWYRYWHEYPTPPKYPDTIFDRSWCFYDNYYGTSSDTIRDTVWIADEIATIYWVDTVTDYWNDSTQAVEYSDLLNYVSSLLDEGSEYKFLFFHIFASTLGRKIEYDTILETRCYPDICTLRVKNFSVRDPLWDDPHLSDQLSIIRNSFNPLPAYETIKNNILIPYSYNPAEHIHAVDIGETKTYQAMNHLSLAGTYGDFTIKGNGSYGGKVAMEAGERINLYDGFKVEKGGYFYAGINPLYGGGAGMSAMKTAVPKEIKTPDETSDNDSIPKVFSCAQNFPNPFANNTTIKYGLPKDTEVQLEIYNLIGQKVKTLVNAKQTAGYKYVSWNGETGTGEKAPQGVYFYTFKAGDFERHHKMILIR